jgi:hypothetical protein
MPTKKTKVKQHKREISPGKVVDVKSHLRSIKSSNPETSKRFEEEFEKKELRTELTKKAFDYFGDIDDAWKTTTYILPDGRIIPVEGHSEVKEIITEDIKLPPDFYFIRKTGSIRIYPTSHILYLQMNKEFVPTQEQIDVIEKSILSKPESEKAIQFEVFKDLKLVSDGFSGEDWSGGKFSDDVFKDFKRDMKKTYDISVFPLYEDE